MNKIYRCLKCGWEKETRVDIDLECPLCHDNLLVEIDDGNTDFDMMVMAVKEEGSKNIWLQVESIKCPVTRIYERQLFFKAGGVIPKKKRKTK